MIQPPTRYPVAGPMVDALFDLTSTVESNFIAGRQILGAPRGPVASDCDAAWDELLWCDPTNGGFTVRLPAACGQRIGSKVFIKNYSDSAETIAVVSPAPALIEGLSRVVLNDPWGGALFVLLAADKWLCIAVGGAPFSEE